MQSINKYGRISSKSKFYLINVKNLNIEPLALIHFWACKKVQDTFSLSQNTYNKYNLGPSPEFPLFGPGVLACATRGGGRSEAGHRFHLLFFLLFFFSAFCFSPTSENLPCVKICFPQYFGITRRYMQKKNMFFR